MIPPGAPEPHRVNGMRRLTAQGADIDPKRLFGKVSNRSATPEPVPERLRSLANDVRRIGDGYRADPETLALRKDDIASRLAEIARELERVS